ncbi:MAG TPA: DUF1800 domain-containing protein [Rhizomicrobium sp.]
MQDEGVERHLEHQLHPDISQLPPDLTAELMELKSLGKGCAELYQEYWWKAQVSNPKSTPREEKKRLKGHEHKVGLEARKARLARAVRSPWQLQEALVEFWFNHFNIYDKKTLTRIWAGAFEEQAIRPHTLGRFENLLLATSRHPAMLVYLDNVKNIAPTAAQDDSLKQSDDEEADTGIRKKKKDTGINENYAREVMELHTLGVDGGYTQADIVSLAHILTGWTVGKGAAVHAQAAASSWKRSRGDFDFAARLHDPRPELLLGREFSGSDIKEGEDALLLLARHPSTAHHISFKLAQYFVDDQPPPALVESMAMQFRTSGGDIRAVLNTMFVSGAFMSADNFGKKFKTPYRYIVSAARAAALPTSDVRPLIGALTELGQPLYRCVTPDGYACTQSAWLDSNSLLHRLSVALRMGAGGYGSKPAADGALVPLDAERLLQTLGPQLGETAVAAVRSTPQEHRAAAILGSPDFMRC